MPADPQKLEAFLANLPEIPETTAPEGPTDAAEAEADPKDELPSKPGEAGTTADSKTSTKTTDDGETGAGDGIDMAAVKRALAEGDIETLADLVGDDPSLYHKGSRKWAAARRVQAEQKRENERVAKQAETVVERWKPVADAADAVRRGDYRRLPELVQQLTGEDWDSLVLKTARARQGQDPTVPALQRRIAELEQQTGAPPDPATADKAYHAIIADELAAEHPVRQLKGWSKKVGAVLRASLDPDLGEPRLSVKQAADRVLRKERAAYEARAKVFGSPPAARPAPARSAVERPALRGSARIGKRDREAFFADVAKRPL